MPAAAALLTLTALLATLVQAPWQHAHRHGHDEHHAASGGSFHVHRAPTGAAGWQAHGPEEDARPLARLVATSRAGVAPAPCALPACAPSPGAPATSPYDAPWPRSRGHDPPTDGLTASRAPPPRPA